MSPQEFQNIILRVRKFIRKTNSLFASATLVVFYFVIVGSTALFIWVAKKIKAKKAKESYWQKAEKKKIDINYFKSPY